MPTKPSSRQCDCFDKPKKSSLPMDSSDRTQYEDDCSGKLACKETRAVYILRAAVLFVIMVTAIIVSVGVYKFMRQEELETFSKTFEDSAEQLIEAFHEGLENNIGAMASMSTAMTSKILHGQKQQRQRQRQEQQGESAPTAEEDYESSSFPFLTMPDFELLGADLRVLSGSNVVVWAPLVTDEDRPAWEDYAMKNRYYVEESFERDTQFREEQDAELRELAHNKNITSSTNEWDRRRLQNLTVLDDGTYYHARIYAGVDEPEGEGPFLPIWQRSPVDPAKQALLNANLARSPRIMPDLQDFLSRKKAMLNSANLPSTKEGKELVENILRISQFRHEVGEYLRDLHSYMVYPVFNSFDNDSREIAGVLITDIFWKLLFARLLPSSSVGIICVIENSSGQTFSYRIDGPDVTFLTMGDPHDPKYDEHEVARDIISYMEEQAGAHNRAYKTVGLSNATQYEIRVYPSEETERLFVSQKPLFYSLTLAGVFSFAAALLLTYSCMVEKRHQLMMKKVIEHGRRATDIEREMNEWIAHEVRNPLSAAISACTFVAGAVNEPEPLSDPEAVRSAREDVQIVSASLHFIQDFLSSTIDVCKVSGQKISVRMAPANVLADIFDPVSNILRTRNSHFIVTVDCPCNLNIMCDSVRLRQVCLNLTTHASKFIEKGFIRMAARIVNDQVKIRVEDSGPGLQPEERNQLFSVHQRRLDILDQGTGVGLNLSKKLMELMDGSIYVDETYSSGIDECPGAAFVCQLNSTPLEPESVLTKEHDLGTNPVLTKLPLDATDSMESQSPERESNNTNLAYGESSYASLKASLASNEIEDIDSSIRLSYRQASYQSLKALFESECATKGITQDGSNTTFTTRGQASNSSLKLSLLSDCSGIDIDEHASTTQSNVEAGTRRPKEVDVLSDDLPKKLSVLFVDDDAILRKLFARAVKKVEPSWELQEAASGERALELCDGQHFDVIFLDQYMSSIEKKLLGTETAEVLREKGKKNIICGLSANNIKESFLKAGADDFLLKPLPCKPDELKSTLLRILGGSSHTV